MLKYLYKRLVALLLVFAVVSSTFVSLVDVAYAGTTVGSSSSISAKGGGTSLVGGVSHAKDITFMVGIVRDKGLYNDGSTDYKALRTAFSTRFPDNRDASMYLIANNARSYYTDGAYKIGEYAAGQRVLNEFSDNEHKSRVAFLNSSSGAPANKAHTLLTGYSFAGGSYDKLAKGKEGVMWTNLANQYSYEDGIAVWSWILAPTSSTSDQNTYDIHTRMNKYISQYAGRSSKDLTVDQKKEVMNGYVGLLFAGRAITPVGSTVRKAWDTAIKDYLLYGNLSDNIAPVSLVIDTAMTISQTGKHRTIMSTVDYHEFYTATSTKRSLYNTAGAVPANSEYAGDTYKLIDGSVDYTIIEDGRSVDRISDVYNENNPFAFGANAVAYPRYRYTTAAITSGRWAATNSSLAVMDTLTLGANPIGTGTIRGFIASGSSLTFDSHIIEPPPSSGTVIPPPKVTPPPPSGGGGGGCPTDASACPPASGDITLDIPDEYSLPYQVGSSELIGVPVPMTISHTPDSENAITLWKNVFKDNWQMVNIKVTDVRRASNPDAVVPVNLNKGTVQGWGADSVWFVDWIQGKQNITLADLGTVTEPIEADTTKRFDYQLTLQFTYKTKDGTTQSYKIDTNVDYASFYRKPNAPDVEPIQYTSIPSAFSELKHGQPDSEDFDAMAGVPSNKRLYVGVGGSEFIVDVELEYKEDVDSIYRTYRSVFTGTASEFKAGDTAPSKTVGGNSVDPHNGGTTTKTWTGSIPWTGTNSHSGWHGGSVTNSWDYSAQKAALAQATAWAAQVNGTVITHTSASDKVTRSFSSWGASVSGGFSEGSAGTWTDGKDPVPEVKPSGTPGKPGYNPGSPEIPGVPAQSTAGTAGSYSYTVVGTVPAHEICGPDCSNDMPSIEDTWKQKITFDYMKISKVEVYKIDEGRITQVSNIFGDNNDILKASIQSGDPNIFYNIAQQNANGDDVQAQSSMSGRLRYSLETLQHDVVVFNEGVRSNKSDGMGNNGSSKSPTNGGHANSWATGILYNNTAYTTEPNHHLSQGGVKSGYTGKADTKDVATMEWKKFDERRKTLNTATVISDMLILQTSSGDQAVMRFEKDSKPQETQRDFEPVKATKEEMWDNNPTSASKWTEEQIYLGSYNGNFQAAGQGAGLNRKYWGFNQVTGSFMDNSPTGENKITTKFDSNGAGQNASRTRPASPSKLYMYGTADIIPTNPNGLYVTGKADVFYQQLLSYKSVNAYEGLGNKLAPFAYTAKAQPTYLNKVGITLNAPYSPEHLKVNDIVVHTPVTAEDAMVLSLDPSRDQRTELPAGGAGSLIEERASLEICPLDPALCEFRVLNCRYHLSETLVNFNFEGATTTTTMHGVTNLAKGASIPMYRVSNGSSSTAIVDGVNGTKGLRVSSTSGAYLNFSDIGLVNTESGTVSFEFDMYVDKTIGSGVLPIVSFLGYTFALTSNGYYLYTGGQSHVIEFKRSRGFAPNEIVPVKITVGMGSALDSKITEFGNALSKTTVGSVQSLSGLKGTKVYFGKGAIQHPTLTTLNTTNIVLDNLKIIKDGGSANHTEECYIVTKTHDVKMTHVHTADCYVGGKATEFAYNGGIQYFTAPASGMYTLETWGAQGGGANPSGSSGSRGGAGGYSKGDTYLAKGETVLIYIGSQGTYSTGLGTGGGYNGGGDGGYNGYGGGGATDIRRTSSYARYSLNNGMNLRAGTEFGSIVSGLKTAVTDNPGEGVYGPYVPVRKGRYQVTVWGENLGIGIPVAYYNQGHNALSTTGLSSSYNVATYYVDVPFDISNMEFCWHQDGAGRMVFYSVEVSRLDERIIVAGGGGGADDASGESSGGDNDGSGGNGGGITGGSPAIDGVPKSGFAGTQSSGFGFGVGESATVETDTGGGGGGYYGGKVTNHYNGGGGGGSGYISGLQNALSQAGVRLGEGHARITPASTTPVCGNLPLNTLSENNIHIHNADCVHDVISGNSTGYRGYTWSQLLGSNWGKYVTTSTQETTVEPTYETKLEWNFKNSNKNNFASSNVSLSPLAQGLHGAVRYADSYIYSTGNLGYQIAGDEIIEIKVQNGTTSGNQAQIYFQSNSAPDFSESAVRHFSMSVNDSSVVTYRIPMAGENWYGTLDRIRFDLANGTNTGAYLLESIKILRKTADGYTNTTTKTTVNTSLIKSNIASFPEKMPDGSWNPILNCEGLPLNAHEHNENCKEVRILECNEPHHSGGHYDGANTICWDACGIDANHVKDKEEVITGNGTPLQRGSFINLDYGFTVYFPNNGDFAQQPTLLGIPTTTTTRGLGYYNNMDTTQYTLEKRVSFDFHVIYENVMYPAGAWISLDLNKEYFDFYSPLANKEAIAARIRYESIPINGIPVGSAVNENYVSVNNKERSDTLRALHGAYKESFIDIVGRIGNFVVSDSEDFRFSNLFKKPKGDDTWLVEGIVPSVNPAAQRNFYADKVDIRGIPVADTGVGLNTWGTQKWLQSGTAFGLPVNALDNTIPALRGEYMKIGYDLLGDITTMGNYQNGVIRILPYYYKLDLDTGQVTPLDVYTPTGETFSKLNIYTGADGGNLPDGLAAYEIKIDWAKESERRNYGLDEATLTDRIAEYHGEAVLGTVNVGGTTETGVVNTKKLTIPLGNYTNIGNAQRVVLDKKARTFLGTSRTYENELNIGSVLPIYDYDYAAQRWHWKLGLPSSAVFVRAGEKPSAEAISDVKKGNSLVLLAADVIAIGDTYTLRWDQIGTTSFTATVNGVTRTFNTVNNKLPPVISLYDLNQSSVVDVSAQGSH